MLRDDRDDRDDKCRVPRTRARDVSSYSAELSKGLLTRRLNLSSLSSLSSLKGYQVIENMRKGLERFSEKNVPFFNFIVPIVPR